MRGRLALVRLGPVVLLAGLGAALLATSSLQRILPVSPPLPLWLATLWVGLLLAFVPALLARGSPLPATLAILVPVLAASAYGASRLDWLRTLKDFHLVDDAGPNLLRLGLAAVALLLAWGLHALDTAFRLRWRSRERGILPGQARAAFRVSLRRSGIAAAQALASAALLAALVLLAAWLGPRFLPVERMAFLAPLAAALLLGVAALLLVGVPRKAGTESADER